jgi:hypothetical protein
VHLYRQKRLAPRRFALERVRELTEAEYQQFGTATAYLNESVLGPQEVLRIISTNLSEVEAFRTDLLARAERGEAVRTTRVDTRELNRRVVNYLTSMRLFLDHTSRRLKRHYGKPSDPLAAFDAARSSAFDGSAAYRIVDELRNYVQHRGLPVHSAGVASELVDGLGGLARYTLAIITDVDALLSDAGGWKHSKPDLEALRPSFDVTALLPTVTAHLAAIYRATALAERSRMIEVGREVLTLLGDALSDGGVPCVGEVKPTANGATMHISEMPWDALAAIGLVRMPDADAAPPPE